MASDAASSPLKPSLVEWKQELFEAVAGNGFSLETFLSGMETLFVVEPTVLRQVLETFLVEWKPAQVENAPRHHASALKASLVEWKQYPEFPQGRELDP
mgnify:CR=1 FL=1